MLSREVRALGICIGLTAGMLSTAYACVEGMGWTATFKGAQGVHVPSRESAEARMLFDPEKPLGTMWVKTTNVKDVSKIELRAVRSTGDIHGPVVTCLYKAADGPYNGSVSKQIGQADLVYVPSLGISSSADVAGAIVRGRAVIVVSTRSNPNGELAGIIGLHKVLVYSSSTGSTHDGYLHHEMGLVHRKS